MIPAYILKPRSQILAKELSSMRIVDLFASDFNTLSFRARRKLAHLYVYATARDFAHKVRVRMKHDRNPLFVTLADKYAVKEYARQRAVKTAKLYHVTTDPETIPFANLPPSYFIKANHGWNWNIVHRDSSFFFYNYIPRMSIPDSQKETHIVALSHEACVDLCRTWLSTTYDSGEWVYEAIAPKILVEETLSDATHKEMSDYRFFAFDGKVKVIEFDNDAYRKNDYGFYADRAWQPYKISAAETPPVMPPKPDNLEEMIAVAERLAEGIDFVRVDLYNTTQGIYLGEMTLFPEAGSIKSPSHNSAFNKWLGDQWVIDKRYFKSNRLSWW